MMNLLLTLALCSQLFSMRSEPVFQLRKGGDQSISDAPGGTVTEPTSIDTADRSPGVSVIRLQQWGASWCPSCPGGKAQAQKAADQLGVRLEYFDYDANKELARSLGVDSVPRTFVVIDGKIRHRYIGQTPSSTIVGKARELSSSTMRGRSTETVLLRAVSADSGPLRMTWNWEGSWNPTTQQMINHLAEHGINANGMTRQQMADAHDAAHGGRSTPVRSVTTSQTACPTCPTTVRRRGRAGGLFR